MTELRRPAIAVARRTTARVGLPARRQNHTRSGDDALRRGHRHSGRTLVKIDRPPHLGSWTTAAPLRCKRRSSASSTSIARLLTGKTLPVSSTFVGTPSPAKEIDGDLPREQAARAECRKRPEGRRLRRCRAVICGVCHAVRVPPDMRILTPALRFFSRTSVTQATQSGGRAGRPSAPPHQPPINVSTSQTVSAMSCSPRFVSSVF